MYKGVTGWLKTVIFLIAPKHLRLIAGRAAKTLILLLNDHRM
jgi:hypothetical protein